MHFSYTLNRLGPQNRIHGYEIKLMRSFVVSLVIQCLQLLLKAVFPVEKYHILHYFDFIAVPDLLKLLWNLNCLDTGFNGSS